uniref:Phosphatidylinositol-3,4,5-trisphosphate 3-phosphatase n=1 Tax=Panagrolaimus sp. JU765 TaxID=591449 RepID=A0AC34Q2S3_9BILA
MNKSDSIQHVQFERPDDMHHPSSSAPTTSLQHSLFAQNNEKSHHGSTSTTFSTGSNLSSSSERGIESSASSGVATMSSTDHLPLTCMIFNGRNLGTNLTSSHISASTSSSSNPSPTLVPFHLENFEDGIPVKNDNAYIANLFPSETMTPTSPNENTILSGKLGLPDSNNRCNSRSSSGKNSPPVTSPLPSASPVPTSVAQSAKDIICVPLRTIVSQNRRRFQSDGFNLDLTYITDRVIAMGYPADTAESLYRNSMKHIVRFLEKFHPGKYKVFNLRGQYAYDEKNFHYRVVSYEMKDHHPPRLELMAPFCREAHDHLSADPSHVIAVHCKAGKGRTGVMICAYLYYIKFFENPRQIMDYYSIVRTHNNKGVTIPSQRRYVYYFAHLRDKQLNYMPLKVELVGVYMERPPRASGLLKRGALTLRVANGDVDVFHGLQLVLTNEQYEEDEQLWKKNPISCGEDSYDPNNPQPNKNCISRRCYGWTVPSNKRVFLEGDIRIDLMKSSQIKPISFFKPDKLGHIWFNTMFTCPGFCGGAYVHGDEAYPYPDNGATIVSKVAKSKPPIFMDKVPTAMMPKSGSLSEKKSPKFTTSSVSVPSSPPCQKVNASPAMQIASPANENEQVLASSMPAYSAMTPLPPTNSPRTPSMENRKSSKNALHGVAKKLAGAIESKKPIRHVDRSSAAQEAKCERWSSQDGGFCNRNKLIDATKPTRASLDYVPDSSESPINDEEIIVGKPPGLDAHCPEETLKDLYPNGNAPRYNIEEMLKHAFKKDLINDNYNERRRSQPQEGNAIPKAEIPAVRPEVGGPFCLMRQPHEHVTVYPAMEIDRACKNKEIDSNFKIYVVTKCVDENCPGDVQLAENFLNITRKKQEEKDAKKSETMRGRKYLEEAKRHKNDAQSYGPTDSDNYDEIPPAENPNQIFRNDPRFSDPHLKKYFFRQRITSTSRHPNSHHHCPLKGANISDCKREGCIQRKQQLFSMVDRPSITTTDSSNSVTTKYCENVEKSGTLTTLKEPVSAEIHGRCATIASSTNEVVGEFELGVGKQAQRSRSARAAVMGKTAKKQSMGSTNSGQSEGGDDGHPTDCSWASSSTSSSCRSFADDLQLSNSDSDNATIRHSTSKYDDCDF